MSAKCAVEEPVAGNMKQAEPHAGELEKEGPHPGITPFLAAAASVLLIQVIAGAAIIYWIEDWAHRGQFGDLFGVTNSLFSGIAFAGLVYTILLQRRELALQRLELRLTRQELARTAVAQEKSERSLEEQAEASRRAANLSSLNFLITRYENRLTAINQQMGSGYGNETMRAERADLTKRYQVLSEIVEKVFTDVVSSAGEGNVRESNN